MNGISSRAARGGTLLALPVAAALALEAGAAGPDAGGKTAGDPANGQRVYARQKCAKCHRIGKEGGLVGPDLTRGEKRPAEWLVAFFKDPRSKFPKTTMPPLKAPEQDLQDLAAYLGTLK